MTERRDNPLTRAARDLRWLLGRGYPRERALILVGDRYRLEAGGRHVLRRAVHAPEAARARRMRLASLAACAGRAVGVDGRNVLITLESALLGRRLVLADDGLVRDAAGLGRNHRPGAETFRAAELTARALAGAGAASVDAWFHAPVSGSGELAAEVEKTLQRHGLAGRARAVPDPERRLIRHAGPVATSNSALIDQVETPLDLAGEIIRGLDPAPLLERLT
jgi:hypothetical protein